MTRHTRMRPLAVVGLAAAISGAATLATASTAGAAETVWDRVAACESTSNWSINTGNGYYGGLQFSAQTWTGFGGGAYARTANLATKAQQITIAQKVLRVQGPGAWPVCSVRAGLTTSNGLAVSPGTSSSTSSTASRSSTRLSIGRLVVDGVRGPLTTGAIERWVGGSVNGSLSGSDTMLLQRKVGAAADGQFGPISTRALQRVVGAYADGEWGPKTTAALQGFLNRVL